MNEQATTTCFNLAGFFHEGMPAAINEFLGVEAIGREVVITIQNKEGTRVAELVFANVEAERPDHIILIDEGMVEGGVSSAAKGSIKDGLTTEANPKPKHLSQLKPGWPKLRKLTGPDTDNVIAGFYCMTTEFKIGQLEAFTALLEHHAEMAAKYFGFNVAKKVFKKMLAKALDRAGDEVDRQKEENKLN